MSRRKPTVEIPPIEEELSASGSTTPLVRRVLSDDSTQIVSALMYDPETAGTGQKGRSIYLVDVELPGDFPSKKVAIKVTDGRELAVMRGLALDSQIKEQVNLVSLLWSEEKPDGVCRIGVSFCERGALSKAYLDALPPKSRNTSLLQIFSDAAYGLKYMHEKGYMHLDIKPQNIFLDSKGRAYIGDFGSSEKYEMEFESLATAEEIDSGRFIGVGSFLYVPPEEIESMMDGTLKVGFKSDVWSLGVVMAQMLGEELGIIKQDDLDSATNEMAAYGIMMKSVDRMHTGDEYTDWCKRSHEAKQRLFALMERAGKGGELIELSPHDMSVALLDVAKWMTAPKEDRPSIDQVESVLLALQTFLPTDQFFKIQGRGQVEIKSSAASPRLFRPARALSGSQHHVVPADDTERKPRGPS